MSPLCCQFLFPHRGGLDLFWNIEVELRHTFPYDEKKKTEKDFVFIIFSWVLNFSCFFFFFFIFCSGLWELVITIRSYMTAVLKYVSFIFLWAVRNQELSCFIRAPRLSSAVFWVLSLTLHRIFLHTCQLAGGSRHPSLMWRHIPTLSSSTSEWTINLEI